MAALKATLKIQATILKGSGLVAKDRNLFGKKTSSDPYVQACVVGGGSKRRGHQRVFGKTSAKSKNLEPVWNETIKGTIPDWDTNTEPTVLLLRIFDQDIVGDDDSMGDVRIPLFSAGDSATQKAVAEAWFDVDPNSAKNATGKLMVRVHAVLDRPIPYIIPPPVPKGMPKRFVKINGVMKLNPEYVKWKEENA